MNPWDWVDVQDWFNDNEKAKEELKRHLVDTCQHQWKEYIGLNEKFSYCTKCDKKDK